MQAYFCIQMPTWVGWGKEKRAEQYLEEDQILNYQDWSIFRQQIEDNESLFLLRVCNF